MRVEGLHWVSLTGTIKDNILEITEIAYHLTKFLLENYKSNLIDRYSLDDNMVNNILRQQAENQNIYKIMQLIGKKRGAIISGGKSLMMKRLLGLFR
ncbi:MAG: hypothetical protein V8R51_00770 [Clostridia bacterium]